MFYIFQIVHYLASGAGRIDAIPIGVESILIFVYIFFFFLERMNTAKGSYIQSHYCFWISVGLLVYLGGSFFINILANSITDDEFAKYWFLNYVADTIKTLLFAVSFLFMNSSTNRDKSAKQTSVPYLDMI
jgi:hypothetical protein